MYKDKKKASENNMRWRKNHPEQWNAIQRKAYLRYKVINKEKLLVNKRNSNKKRKLEVLTAYGKNGVPECFCCGEKELDFLCLDHPNNDGKKHRKDLEVFGSGTGFYSYLRKNKYPKSIELQTSCYNCNNSRKISGTCVHKK